MSCKNAGEPRCNELQESQASIGLYETQKEVICNQIKMIFFSNEATVARHGAINLTRQRPPDHRELPSPFTAAEPDQESVASDLFFFRRLRGTPDRKPRTLNGFSSASISSNQMWPTI
ncbi:hypothetical protein MRB53_030085 [Persea americana]|uniref:Uncharacterized protein n=1 Tax=Persea americana TaxID=3435 RepID=A0ACC2KKB6_PERAE|nr:hypothetical protein MRB53_030085 [Persea americana]